MGHAPGVGVIGEELLAGHLLAGKSVPQPVLGADAAIGLLADAAGDQRLRIDHLPVVEARRGVRARYLFDEGALVDRREQAGPLQVGGDDFRDLRAQRIVGLEIRDGDRQRLDIALVDVELDEGPGLQGGGGRHAHRHSCNRQERLEERSHVFSLLFLDGSDARPRGQASPVDRT